jgi:hypothetical protein
LPAVASAPAARQPRRRFREPQRDAFELDNVRGSCEENTKLKDIFERQMMHRAHQHFNVFMQNIAARHKLDVPT